MPLIIKAPAGQQLAGQQLAQDGIGHTLLGLSQEAGLQVNARCAGEGVCGSCAVILCEGQFVIGNEKIVVSADQPRPALACQTKLASADATVRFPRTSIVERDAKIDDQFSTVPSVREAYIQKFLIEVPESDREGRRSLLDVVHEQLRRRGADTQGDLPVELLRKLPAALNQGNRCLTVTACRDRQQWKVIDIQPGDTRSSHFGIAVDIGTTTVVAILVDLNDGRVLKRASLYNQQIRLADDVASRISLCRSADNIGELQRLIVEETINPLISALCAAKKICQDTVAALSVSGNTVMAHLFLGVSPESIGQLPFQPVVNRHGQYRAGDLGLNIKPTATVNVIPSVAGYVGGDIVADIYIARLNEVTEPTLLVDIGTNGEIVFSENGSYAACATAAGPAFEGYGTAHGCRAAAGAIEHITIGDGLRFQSHIIGGGKAHGLCGSAFIDFIAEAMRCGLINHLGRFNIQLLLQARRHLLIEELCGPVNACVIIDAEQSAHGETIYVSERDVAQILKAKAAVFAGMKTLIGTRGKRLHDIKRFCLAGGFARHIDLQNAIFIGLLPEIPIDRFDVIGNGSLAGAMAALVDARAMDAYETLALLPEVIELNRVASFENNFIDALALPNWDPHEFPDVNAELRSQAS